MTTVLAARSPSRWPRRLPEGDEAAEQIAGGQKIDRAEEIANDDLAELQLRPEASITRRRRSRLPQDWPRHRHSVKMP